MTGAEEKPRLGATATRRILAVTDIGLSRPFLDGIALARCIDVCVDLYSDAKLFNTHAIKKKHRDELTKVLRTASRLKGQLASISNPSFLPNHDKALIHLSKLVEEMKRVSELHSLSRRNPGENIKRAASNQRYLSSPETGLEYDYVKGLAYANHFKSKSPLQWLVGVYLVEVYEIFVGKRDRKYLAFAHQILKELKIKDGNSYYSREAIARAARGYSRKRKLAPPVDQDEWTNDRQMRFSWACAVHESLDPSTELLRREREAAKIGKSKPGPKSI